MDYFYVVVFDECFHVAHATVTDLDGFLVKYTVQFVLFGEFFSISLRKTLQMFVCTFILYGRVVPYYAALSVPPVACRLFAVGEGVGVPTGF